MFGLRAAKPVATVSSRMYVIEIFKPNMLRADKFLLELVNIKFCYNHTQPLPRYYETRHIIKYVWRIFPTPFVFEITELKSLNKPEIFSYVYFY